MNIVILTVNNGGSIQWRTQLWMSEQQDRRKDPRLPRLEPEGSVPSLVVLRTHCLTACMVLRKKLWSTQNLISKQKYDCRASVHREMDSGEREENQDHSSRARRELKCGNDKPRQ